MLDIETDTEVVAVIRAAYIVARVVATQKELMTALNALEGALDKLIARYGREVLGEP